MNKKINLLIIVLFILTCGLKAQSITSPTKGYFNLTLPATSAPANLLKATASVIVEDVSIVSKIRVKLGKVLGGFSLLSRTYLKDDLIVSHSQGQKDCMITIELGTFSSQELFYCEVILEDSLGNLSEPLKFQSNQ